MKQFKHKNEAINEQNEVFNIFKSIRYILHDRFIWVSYERGDKNEPILNKIIGRDDTVE